MTQDGLVCTVADSRNDRIQVFSSSGVFLRKFGGKDLVLESLTDHVGFV